MDHREPDFLHRITLAGANLGNCQCVRGSYFLDLDHWQCALLLERLVDCLYALSELIWYDTLLSFSVSGYAKKLQFSTMKERSTA